MWGFEKNIEMNMFQKIDFQVFIIKIVIFYRETNRFVSQNSAVID